MITINKLDGGARYLIEAEDGRVAFTLAEVDELAQLISHRLSGHVARGGSGLVLRTPKNKQVHLAYGDEVPGLVNWMKKEFASDFAAIENPKEGK